MLMEHQLFHVFLLSQSKIWWQNTIKTTRDMKETVYQSLWTSNSCGVGNLIKVTKKRAILTFLRLKQNFTIEFVFYKEKNNFLFLLITRLLFCVFTEYLIAPSFSWLQIFFEEMLHVNVFTWHKIKFINSRHSCLSWNTVFCRV